MSYSKSRFVSLAAALLDRAAGNPIQQASLDSLARYGMAVTLYPSDEAPQHIPLTIGIDHAAPGADHTAYFLASDEGCRPMRREQARRLRQAQRIAERSAVGQGRPMK